MERCVGRDGDRRERPLLEKSMLMTGECCHTQRYADRVHMLIYTNAKRTLCNYTHTP